MLVVSRKKDEAIVIGSGSSKIVVTILAISANTVRVGVEAPKDQQILRSELLGREPNQTTGRGA